MMYMLCVPKSSFVCLLLNKALQKVVKIVMLFACACVCVYVCVCKREKGELKRKHPSVL